VKVTLALFLTSSALPRPPKKPRKKGEKRKLKIKQRKRNLIRFIDMINIVIATISSLNQFADRKELEAI